MTERPLGRRFSHLYLEKGNLTSDSPRFRARLAAYMTEHREWFTELRGVIGSEIGLRVEVFGTRPDWNRFLPRIDIIDLLDLFPFAAIAAEKWGAKATFIAFVERALREERLHYTVDRAGGIHPYVDASFQTIRVEVIRGLGERGNAAALEHFEAGMDALVRQDTLAAVRQVYDAVESLFKNRFDVPRLGKAEIDRHLAPVARARYVDRAADATGRFVVSFGEWVNACHQYRHADGAPEPTPPPRDLAVALISSGATYLRWLIDANCFPDEVAAFAGRDAD